MSKEGDSDRQMHMLHLVRGDRVVMGGVDVGAVASWGPHSVWHGRRCTVPTMACSVYTTQLPVAES